MDGSRSPLPITITLDTPAGSNLKPSRDMSMDWLLKPDSIGWRLLASMSGYLLYIPLSISIANNDRSSAAALNWYCC